MLKGCTLTDNLGVLRLTTMQKNPASEPSSKNGPSALARMHKGALIVSATVLLAVLSGAARPLAASGVQPSNSPVVVHWWVVNTGLGSLGYSDDVYILDAPKADGTYFHDRFVHLGPLGSFRTGMSGPVVCVLTGLSVAVIAGVVIAWIARARKVTHDCAP